MECLGSIQPTFLHDSSGRLEGSPAIGNPNGTAGAVGAHRSGGPKVREHLFAGSPLACSAFDFEASDWVGGTNYSIM